MEYWTDTNIILRFLTGDHREHSAAAKRIMLEANEGKHTLRVHSVVLAECCYVLEGPYYGYDRTTIGTALMTLLNSKGIKPESPVLLHALDIYMTHNVDFEDAFLAAASHRDQVPIVSFNKKDFQKCGCNVQDPMKMV
jgi:predicted nucleic-acid-binding protein